MGVIHNIKSFCKDHLNWFILFVVLETAGLTVFLVFDLIYHGSPLYSLMLNPLTQFYDFFMHFGFASAPIGTNIYDYSSTACFPPFAYLIYAFLSRVGGYRAEDPTNTRAHMSAGYNLTIYLVCSMICTVLLLYAISLYIRRKGALYRVVFPCLLIVSYPFMFTTLQRGNSVILVAVLMSIALAWRDDPSKVKRELAMVLIAVCAGLKIYPAVFGLMYLKEKRFKETVRLLIYGLVIFFVPFVFFGGMEGFKTLLATLFELNGSVNRCSVAGLTNALTEGLFGQSRPIFSTMIQQLFLLFSVVAFFMTKERHGEVMILCCLMTVYISSSWMYTSIYLLPAMLVFFSREDFRPIRLNRKNWFDAVIFFMFVIVFSIPYPLGFTLIYDTVIVVDTVYLFKVMIEFMFRKFSEGLARQDT